MDFGLELHLNMFDKKIAGITPGLNAETLQARMKDWFQFVSISRYGSQMESAFASTASVKNWRDALKSPGNGGAENIVYSLARFKDDLGIQYLGMARLISAVDYSVIERLICHEERLPSSRVTATVFLNRYFLPMAIRVKAALLLGQSPATTTRDAHTIPASDRVVTINHNNPDISTFENDIAELEIAIRESNEFGSSIPERRVYAEIVAAKGLIAQEEAQLSIIDGLVRSFLTFLKDKVAGGLIANLVARLILNWHAVMHFLSSIV